MTWLEESKFSFTIKTCIGGSDILVCEGGKLIQQNIANM